MKLTVENSIISLKKDATISIERTSPLMDDSPNAFSYPSPVPRRPNQEALSWPGKLERSGAIETQDFILESGGLQILRGQVEYDRINDDQIPIILKSGYSEFRGKMEGRKLSEISFGYETGLPNTSTLFTVMEKMADWDDANINGNDIYVMAPCALKADDPNAIPAYINKINYAEGLLKFTDSNDPNMNRFMFQFYAWFILEKIFESAGYTVEKDELKDSAVLHDIVVFSKVFRLRRRIGTPNVYWIDGMKTDENLYYSKLMPDITALEFADNILRIGCLMANVNEQNKTVRIVRKDIIFGEAQLDKAAIKELTGWEHAVNPPQGGFRLGYGDQWNELDTKSDYVAEREENYLPLATEEGEIIHIIPSDTDWITILNGETLEWEQIGRLKDKTDGNASDEIRIEVKVPPQVMDPDVMPLPEAIVEIEEKTNLIKNFEELVISLWRGCVDFYGPLIPHISASPITGDSRSLAPDYLYTAFYDDFMEWKCYNARSFKKQISLSLEKVIALSWEKMYVISGVKVVITKINFDLPYRGTAVIEGYTGAVAAES